MLIEVIKTLLATTESNDLEIRLEDGREDMPDDDVVIGDNDTFFP